MRILPVPHSVTYKFGVKDSAYRLGFHPGTDYGSPSGTPVKACQAGSVSWIGDLADGYGKQMKLTLDSGGVLYYCHLSSASVPNGRVAQSQVIAISGSTGFVKGPHLHIEYRPTDDVNKPADFELWLKGEDMPVPEDVRYIVFRGILGREPTRDEMLNQDYINDFNLLVRTVWNQGGKDRYEAPRELDAYELFVLPELFIKKKGA